MSGAKQIAKAAASILAWPWLVRYRLVQCVMGPSRAFIAMSERVAKKPGMMGIYSRQSYYKNVLDHVGQDVHFGFMSLLSKPKASIGDRVYIGRFCTLGWVELGDDVMLADAVQILSGGNQHGDQSQVGQGQTLHDNEQQFSKVTVGKGAWIGAGAIVMADVGEGAIVGAGAVVTKPVEAGTRVGGVPAKVLGSTGATVGGPQGTPQVVTSAANGAANPPVRRETWDR